jgi:hypothetical protein
MGRLFFSRLPPDEADAGAWGFSGSAFVWPSTSLSSPQPQQEQQDPILKISKLANELNEQVVNTRPLLIDDGN